MWDGRSTAWGRAFLNGKIFLQSHPLTGGVPTSRHVPTVPVKQSIDWSEASDPGVLYRIVLHCVLFGEWHSGHMNTRIQYQYSVVVSSGLVVLVLMSSWCLHVYLAHRLVVCMCLWCVHGMCADSRRTSSIWIGDGQFFFLHGHNIMTGLDGQFFSTWTQHRHDCPFSVQFQMFLLQTLLPMSPVFAPGGSCVLAYTLASKSQYYQHLRKTTAWRRLLRTQARSRKRDRLKFAWKRDWSGIRKQFKPQLNSCADSRKNWSKHWERRI